MADRVAWCSIARGMARRSCCKDPKRRFAMPETFLLKMGERIGKEPVVAHHKTFQAEDDLRERTENQQRQQQSANRHGVNHESGLAEVWPAGWLHAQIKTSNGAKGNVVRLQILEGEALRRFPDFFNNRGGTDESSALHAQLTLTLPGLTLTEVL